MATQTLTVRALDLGSVRGGRQSYRSMGFDLTRIRGPVTGCWIRFGSSMDASGLRLGEAARQRSYLAHEPTATGPASDGRRRLTRVGVSLVNEATGGYLTFEAWGAGASQAPGSDVRLELQIAMSLMERQAA